MVATALCRTAGIERAAAPTEDLPSPRATLPHAATVCLRVGAAFVCVGAAGRALSEEGPLFSALFTGLGWPEGPALAVVRGGAYALLACAPLLLWRRGWPALGLVSTWAILETAAQTWDEVWHPELIALGAAARCVAPLALAALLASPAEGGVPRRRQALALAALRAAAAATFIGHGLAALLQKGEFVDLLITARRDVLGIPITEAEARRWLEAIGTVDLLAGCAILLPARLRLVAVWMAYWGFLTAGARLVRLGWEGWPQAALRALNGAVPLALFLCWRLDRPAKESRHENVG